MQRRICPICDHPIKYGHYCSFCKQWIRNPNYVNATYYLNERHPAHETDCEYHNAGSASWETSARAGTDAIRTLADRAKAYSDAESSRRRQTGIRPDTEPEQYVVSDNAETKCGAARKKSEKEGENEPCAGDFADFVCFVWN